MTITELTRLESIRASIRRGDYRGLAGDGQALVFARAAELGVTAPELIRSWAAGTGVGVESTRRTTVTAATEGLLDDDPPPKVGEADDEDEDEEDENDDDEPDDPVDVLDDPPS